MSFKTKISISKQWFRKRKRILDYILLLLCGLLTLYIAFYKLGLSALENWDEAWYGDVVRHMLRAKEYILLYWNREIFLDKPPLYMWLSALTAKFIGLSELSMRFVSAVSGFITILIVMLSSYRMYGLVPALISFSTLAFNDIYIWRVRSGNLDSLLTLLFVLVYFAMVSNRRYRYILIGLFFGLIYLTKLTVVAFPLTIFVISELIYENKKILFRIPHYIVSAAIFVAVCGFWLYFGSEKAGPEFYRYFIYRADQGVSQISLSNLKKDYLNYMYYSLQRRFFWLVLIGLGAALLRIGKKRYFVQILFAVGLVVQLSMSGRNNNWYLLPSIPFWSMLAALATYQIFKIAKYNFLLVSVFCLLSLYISFKTLTVNIMAVVNTSGPVKMKESSLKINSLSNADDIVVRLDHLYPTTIYYTDRKVHSSPDGAGSTGLFMSREDLQKKLNNNEIKWAVGVNGDVKAFLQKYEVKNYELIDVNDEETILHIKPIK